MFAAVVRTAGFNAAQRLAYCRERDLYSERP
jgi:hypothetical protein